MKRLSVCLLLFVLAVTICPAAFGAKKSGSLLPEDFTFNGAALGDTMEVMQEKLGEPDFDTDIVVLDQAVKCYVYSADLKVCTDPRTDKIVAFVCRDKEYKARDGVTYGATRAKLMQTYGKAEREKRDGNLYYVYRNPEDEKQKLMLQLEPAQYYVESFLITSLPLTEDEIAEYEMGEFPPELLGGDEEPELRGGFNSRGEWWMSYGTGSGASVGIE